MSNRTPAAPALAAALALLLATQAGAAAKVELVSAVRDPQDPDACLSVKSVTYAPGQGSPSHIHDATVIAYVLQGAVESQVDDQPLRTYGPGESWTEAPNAAHKVSRNASATVPATVLAIMLAHRGSEEVKACAN